MMRLNSFYKYLAMSVKAQRKACKTLIVIWSALILLLL